MYAARSTEIYVREDKRGGEDPDSRVLDLVHLARQTDGDAALEAELLAMFDAQSAKLTARLALAEVGAQAKADIAHRLRGSALAIGARRVAEAAAIVEAHFAAVVAGKTSAPEPLGELFTAVHEARAAIARLTG